MTIKRQSLTRRQDGFSLTELLVVIVIIGILAALAIPRFLSVTSRAKMTEAKLALSQLHSLQQAYALEHDVYAETLDALGFEQTALITDGGTARYRIAITQASATEYVATATAVVDFDKDGTFNVWQIDQVGKLKQSIAD